MNKWVLLIAFGFCMTGWLPSANGQEDCARKLERAKRLYEDGMPQMIPLLLEDCRKSRALTKEEHIEVLQLVAQSYLEMNNTEKAEEYYLKILDINPDYRPDIAASPDLYYMASEMERNPYLMFSMKGGMGLINVEKIREYDINTVFNEFNAVVTSEEYRSNFESQFTAAAEFNLFKSNFDLSIGLGYGTYSYDYTGGLNLDTMVVSYLSSNMFFSERQKWLSAPVLLRYNFNGGSFLGRENRPEKNYTPYLYMGFSPQWLLEARIENPRLTGLDLERAFVTISQDTGLPLAGSESPKPRNTWNMSFQAGGGIKRKFGNLYVFVEAGISNMGKNVSDTDNKFIPNPPNGSTLKKLRDEYFYVEDDFRLSRIELSVGFTYSFYRLLKNVYRD